MATQSILCAVDFSKASEDALRFAAEEALMRGARLDIVHVWTPGTFVANSLGLPAANDQAEPQRTLDQLQVPSKIVHYRKHLLCGLPRDCIARLASQLRSEMLVVGSHSQPRLARWMLGSVAESLTRVAPCPVVVVRPKVQLPKELRQASASPLLSAAFSGGI